jgi:hypothetical protein
MDRRPISSGQIKMEAGAQMSRIVEIASRSMYGEATNQDDVREALQTLDSTVALDRYAASVILFIAKAPEFSTAIALERLESECKSTPDQVEAFWLNCAVSFLSDEQLVANESIRLFIYRSAFSEQIACRSNTMTILERLARCGDSTALALLRICVSSEKPQVRTNARSSLRAIESDSKSG